MEANSEATDSNSIWSWKRKQKISKVRKRKRTRKHKTLRGAGSGSNKNLIASTFLIKTLIVVKKSFKKSSVLIAMISFASTHRTRSIVYCLVGCFAEFLFTPIFFVNTLGK